MSKTFVLLGTVATLAALTALGSASASAAGCASPPSAVTHMATGVSASGATLQGSVDPNGCSTTYSFEYGPTAGYGGSTGATSAGSGMSSIGTHATIAGLAASTAYHFRIVAKSAGGTTLGQDAVFHTAANCAPGGVMPSVTSSTATGLSASAATLKTSVNPNGCKTAYSFQYGASASYGSLTVTRDAGFGTIPVPASTRVTGLAASTVYHFRVVASNAAGTTYGPDVPFQTTANCVRGGTRPFPVTGTPVGVTGSGATLRGSIDPAGCTTAYRFAYGTTTAYGRETPVVQAGSGTSFTAVSASIAGLVPNTTYHFSILAYGPGGTVLGHDAMFKTGASSVLGAAVFRSEVRIVRDAASLERRYWAGVLLSCSAGVGRCHGALSLFRAHHFLGAHGFNLRAGAARVVFVHLNGRGRALMRAHRVLRVEVVARSSRAVKVKKSLMLIRRFHRAART